MRLRLARIAAWLVPAGVLSAAAWFLWAQLVNISWTQVRNAIVLTPSWRIVACAACTGVSFFCLGMYEVWATRATAGRTVSARQSFTVGVLSHALANTVGFHAITGALVRRAAYRPIGLNAASLARLMAIVAAFVLVGAVVVAGVAALVVLGTQSDAAVPVAAMVAVALLVVCWRWLHSRVALQWRQHSALRWMPSYILPACALEMASAIAALWVLLPSGVAPESARFVLLYLGAVLLGLASHVPGGIGVFEAAVITGMHGNSPAPVLAALLLYRVIYGLVPFVLSLLALPVVLRASGSTVAPHDGTQFDGG